MTETRKGKIVITGAAGLVGQNLIPRLRAKGFTEIVAMDKHPTNVKILKKYHPTVRVLHKDLADESTSTHGWGEELIACEALVIAHAQIGGVDSEEFIRNNVVATERLLEAAIRYKVPYIISISSSVVNSMAVDNYTETKKVQEACDPTRLTKPEVIGDFGLPWFGSARIDGRICSYCSSSECLKQGR
jgi:nucleoside-diphosphate-sugar epimerase